MHTQWCEACFDQTVHFTNVLPGRTACRACRAREKPPKAARPGRADQKALTAKLHADEQAAALAARSARAAEKMKFRAEALAARQAARLAARFEPRWCPRCGEVTERVRNPDGTAAGCAPCRRKRNIERSARERKLRAIATPRNRKSQRIANPQAACPSGHHDWNAQGVCRACLRLKNRHKRSAPEIAAVEMWKRAKSRALAKGRAFDIGPADCAVPAACPVFGPFVLDGKSGLVGMGPSLDRIDSTKGYVRGNVRVISGLANTIKGPWTREQLRAVVNCDAIWPA